MGHSCSHGIEKIQLQAEESGDSRQGLGLRACGIPEKGGRFARDSCSKRLTYLTALLVVSLSMAELWHQLIGEFPPNIRKLSGFSYKSFRFEGDEQGHMFPNHHPEKITKSWGTFCYMFDDCLSWRIENPSHIQTTIFGFGLGIPAYLYP